MCTYLVVIMSDPSFNRAHSTALNDFSFEIGTFRQLSSHKEYGRKEKEKEKNRIVSRLK